MQAVTYLCTIYEAIRPTINLVILWFSLTPILFALLAILLIIKPFKSILIKTSIVVFAGIPLLFFSFATTILLALMINDFTDPSPQASFYFPLNAAIKNTCYLDPKMVHCPHTLEDLIAIEPQNFTKYLDFAHLTYSYYPDTNQYTLIVRYNNNRAVIFDPRLKDDTRGLPDFAEVDVSSCGQDHIVSPPSFPGPWYSLNSNK